MDEMIKDLVIIGAGPAGLSAAVYGKRAMLDEIVIEKDVYGGGQIAVTERVDNYLGLYGENGYDLATKFKEHAKALQVPFLEDEVVEIIDGTVKHIKLASGKELLTKAIFLATGAGHKKLGCKGEEEHIGAGVSYCATCDGAFFRNRVTAVVGGGDVALQDALYLANLCEKVYLIHRRETLRGAKNLQERVLAKDNIEFIPNAEIEEILGDGIVEEIILKKRSDDGDGGVKQEVERETLKVSGVFVAVGMQPNTKAFETLVDCDANGYIVADESCRTSKRGIYAIGDIRTKQLRQLVTAVADGAVAVSSLEQDEI